jgi:Ni/Fe-hydrogenase subunit HybB-like protein
MTTLRSTFGEIRTAGRSFPIGTSIVVALAVLGLGVMIHRYLNGLGAISNLSDGRAWGLWISFDLYCGVALARFTSFNARSTTRW